MLDYFSEEESAKIRLRQQISARLKTTQTALRMRVSRTMRSLKNCDRECMSETRVT
jgi:hypothetical protein